MPPPHLYVYHPVGPCPYPSFEDLGRFTRAQEPDILSQPCVQEALQATQQERIACEWRAIRATTLAIRALRMVDADKMRRQMRGDCIARTSHHIARAAFLEAVEDYRRMHIAGCQAQDSAQGSGRTHEAGEREPTSQNALDPLQLAVELAAACSLDDADRAALSTIVERASARLRAGEVQP